MANKYHLKQRSIPPFPLMAFHCGSVKSLNQNRQSCQFTLLNFGIHPAGCFRPLISSPKQLNVPNLYPTVIIYYILLIINARNGHSQESFFIACSCFQSCSGTHFGANDPATPSLLCVNFLCSFLKYIYTARVKRVLYSELTGWLLQNNGFKTLVLVPILQCSCKSFICETKTMICFLFLTLAL